MRVLVVDDEPLLVKSLRRVLVREGHEVFTAGDGAQALELLQTVQVDVVLSDVRMPVMDGVTLLRRIRAGLVRALPVILLTGYADSSDAELKQVGATAVLGKPVELETLLAALQLGLSSR